ISAGRGRSMPRLELLEDRNLLSGDIHTIQHVIVIMQENRSFDHYFGTFPGADGIPTQNGIPAVSIPDPTTGGMATPFHSHQDAEGGGPHGYIDAVTDIHGGKMDGFLRSFQQGQRPGVMCYHDDREVPNYWAYARNFVLQDHMFQPD